MSENNQNFLNQLAYFGGSISGDPKSIKSKYQDLEDFVILATQHMSDDPRITHCFLTWLEFYGNLLSPAKIRKLLGSRKYNSVVLGAFVSILKCVSLRKDQWNILLPFIKKTTHQTLFPNFPSPKQSLNPHFKSVGLIAHLFSSEPKKFLIALPFILNNCPEIKYRAIGIGTVIADLRSFLEKESPQSLYEIAKKTHHFRAQIYLNYKVLSQFGLFDGSLLKQKSAA